MAPPVPLHSLSPDALGKHVKAGVTMTVAADQLTAARAGECLAAGEVDVALRSVGGVPGMGLVRKIVGGTVGLAKSVVGRGSGGGAAPLILAVISQGEGAPDALILFSASAKAEEPSPEGEPAEGDEAPAPADTAAAAADKAASGVSAASVANTVESEIGEGWALAVDDRFVQPPGWGHVVQAYVLQTDQRVLTADTVRVDRREGPSKRAFTVTPDASKAAPYFKATGAYKAFDVDVHEGPAGDDLTAWLAAAVERESEIARADAAAQGEGEGATKEGTPAPESG